MSAEEDYKLGFDHGYENALASIRYLRRHPDAVAMYMSFSHPTGYDQTVVDGTLEAVMAFLNGIKDC